MVNEEVNSRTVYFSHYVTLRFLYSLCFFLFWNWQLSPSFDYVVQITHIPPAYAGFCSSRASVSKVTKSLPTPVSATSTAPQLVPVVCKVSPNVRDALKQLLTLKRTTICRHLLDLISISLSDMAKVCPSADKLLKLGGLSPDPRADKICAGWSCSICTHYTKCMQGDPDVLFMPTKEHLDNARSRGWKIEVSYEEVTVMKPVVSVTELPGCTA